MEYPVDFESHMIALCQYSKFADEEQGDFKKRSAYAALAQAHASGAIAAAVNRLADVIQEGQGV
jgi:hypothetical protein